MVPSREDMVVNLITFVEKGCELLQAICEIEALSRSGARGHGQLCCRVEGGRQAWRIAIRGFS